MEVRQAAPAIKVTTNSEIETYQNLREIWISNAGLLLDDGNICTEELAF